jgi:FixJ family two-component response regulator
MAKVFIYGTEEGVTRKLSQSMQKEGYRVSCCDASGKLPSSPAAPAVVILDARMKWSVCRPLFRHIQTLGYPVLFLTADKEMTTHLRALYRGQTDVLMIPFSPKTAAAKVRALLGHSEPLRELTIDEAERVALLMASGWSSRRRNTHCCWPDGKPDMPISREQCCARRGDTKHGGDAHGGRARAAPAQELGVDRIETVYKCGYRLKMARPCDRRDHDNEQRKAAGT